MTGYNSYVSSACMIPSPKFSVAKKVATCLSSTRLRCHYLVQLSRCARSKLQFLDFFFFFFFFFPPYAYFPSAVDLTLMSLSTLGRISTGKTGHGPFSGRTGGAVY